MAPKRRPVETPPPAGDSSDTSSSDEDEHEASRKQDYIVKPANPARAPNPDPAPRPSSDDDDDDEGEESGEEESESESEAAARREPPKKQPPPPTTPKPAVESSESESDEDEEEEEEAAGAGHELTKKPPPPTPKPAVESSESESDDEEEEEEAGREQTKKQTPTPKPPAESFESGSTDDADAESDSEESSGERAPASASRPPRAAAADPSIKPIASKPMGHPTATKDPAAPPSSAPRPSREEPEPAKKKQRTPEAAAAAAAENGGQKRQLFQRLWSLEDELAILRGLAEFRAKNGFVPSSVPDKNRFHKVIRDSLGVEVSSDQLINKIRRLKKKFETTSAKRKKGEEFSNAHDQTSYELSKKVWGANDGGDSDSGDEMLPSPPDKKRVKSAVHGAASPSVAAAANPSANLNGYPYLREAVSTLAEGNPCGFAMKRALERVDDSTAKAMNERFKKLKLTEIRQHLRRLDLEKETAKLVFEAILKAD